MVNATIDTGESEPELRVQPAAIELGAVCDGETEVEMATMEALLTVTDLAIQVMDGHCLTFHSSNWKTTNPH